MFLRKKYDSITPFFLQYRFFEKYIQFQNEKIMIYFFHKRLRGIVYAELLHKISKSNFFHQFLCDR